MKIKEIMTTDVLTVRSTTPLKEAAVLLAEHRHLRAAGRRRRGPCRRRALGGGHPLQGESAAREKRSLFERLSRRRRAAST